MTSRGKIIEGDCLEVMKTFEDNQFDLVLTDPPYGIEYDNTKYRSGSKVDYGAIKNDAGELDYKSLIKELQRVGKRVIIFGAINFLDALPHKGIWICWDKRTHEIADKILGSPFELAWCDKPNGYHKMYRIMHNGVINADGGNVKREHPTQKPAKLMRAIIADFTKEGDSVLDPFAGSGTTLRAAKDLNRDCTVIEINPKYVEIIKKRERQEVLL